MVYVLSGASHRAVTGSARAGSERLMGQPVSSSHTCSCETESHTTCWSHKNVPGKINGKESDGVHDDTPVNGNASSHDTPAGAVHTINWNAKFGGVTVSDAKRLKELEQENSKLKRLLAESMLDNTSLKDLLKVAAHKPNARQPES